MFEMKACSGLRELMLDVGDKALVARRCGGQVVDPMKSCDDLGE